MTHLVYCLDGTSNTYDDVNPTNVVMIHESTLESCSNGEKQISHYEEGVGTKRGERVLGGALGLGLMDNVIKAYKHLCEHYNDGDKIFIFGFSRGAYTARTLVGLIGHCGIISKSKIGKELKLLLKEARNLYKNRLTSRSNYINKLKKWRVENSPRANSHQVVRSLFSFSILRYSLRTFFIWFSQHRK